MSAVSVLNPQADVLRRFTAYLANSSACQALASCLKSNLGPRGTLCMLVGGAGQIKVTKDGNVLMSEMQIQHPTASMVARAATALDSITGDGTTSTAIMIGELLQECDQYVISKRAHPHVLCDGINLAKEAALALLDQCKMQVPLSRTVLQDVARTSLRTKLQPALADQVTEIVVDAIQTIRVENQPLDLFMVEILSIRQNLTTETRFINGMVMDHGARHPDMPKRLKNCYVLTCNVSLEYEKSEVNSGFYYSSAAQRAKLVDAERRFTDEKVYQIIELKNKVCTPENKMNFVVFNQKGIDPMSLDLLAREGILALRRVKRRNMERLTLCCGGNAMNSVYGLTPEDLGFAGEVYEESIQDEKWTFVEQVKNPKSCAILVKGPNDHSITQIKDALRDGLRAVKNCIDDQCLIPGAGAFEMAAYTHLKMLAENHQQSSKLKFGILAFANALLSVPRALCSNSGLDQDDCVLRAIAESQAQNKLHGIDVFTGQAIQPQLLGIYDNYCVKKQCLSVFSGLTQQLLLIDEIIKAGKQMKAPKPQPEDIPA